MTWKIQGVRGLQGAELDLSPEIMMSGGFGQLSIDVSGGAPGAAGGNITIPVGADLAAPAGGSISLKAANIDVEGALSAPGGSLSLFAYNIYPIGTTGISTPAADPTRGTLTIGSTASVSTAGPIVSDFETSASAGSEPKITTGGKISIGGYDADIESGATIDASGGHFTSVRRES